MGVEPREKAEHLREANLGLQQELFRRGQTASTRKSFFSWFRHCTSAGEDGGRIFFITYMWYGHLRKPSARRNAEVLSIQDCFGDLIKIFQLLAYKSNIALPL